MKRERDDYGAPSYQMPAQGYGQPAPQAGYNSYPPANYAPPAPQQPPPQQYQYPPPQQGQPQGYGLDPAYGGPPPGPKRHAGMDGYGARPVAALSSSSASHGGTNVHHSGQINLGQDPQSGEQIFRLTLLLPNDAVGIIIGKVRDSLHLQKCHTQNCGAYSNSLDPCWDVLRLPPIVRGSVSLSSGCGCCVVCLSVSGGVDAA